MTPEILSITESTTLNADTLRFEPIRVVRWKLGPHGPFTFQVPEARFTAAYVREQLDRLAAEILALAPPKA